MEQVPNSASTPKGENRYNALGEEVAFVLASARDAAAEMRDQAKHYADALIAGANQQVEEMKAHAEDECDRIVEEAQVEADEIVRNARCQVLEILEAAQSRARNAERATEEAILRRDEILAVEAELETRVGQTIEALAAHINELRVRRDLTDQDDVGPAATPSEAIDRLSLANAVNGRVEPEQAKPTTARTPRPSSAATE